uniref:SKIP_SNW domain-containing protein n=1 Tax=Macrostomum lignano TaxID=282301 RepID=A0A1I8FNU5_9PLAT
VNPQSNPAPIRAVNLQQPPNAASAADKPLSAPPRPLVAIGAVGHPERQEDSATAAPSRRFIRASTRCGMGQAAVCQLRPHPANDAGRRFGSTLTPSSVRDNGRQSCCTANLADLLPKPSMKMIPASSTTEESIKDLMRRLRMLSKRLVESKAAASNPNARVSEPGRDAGYNSGSAPANSSNAWKPRKTQWSRRDSGISKKDPATRPARLPRVMQLAAAQGESPPTGRGLQASTVNEKFVMLAEALHTAEVKSREGRQHAAKVPAACSRPSARSHEETLQQIASRRLSERAGLDAGCPSGRSRGRGAERDAIRRSAPSSRAHERNRKGGGRPNRPRPDISEQIALGFRPSSAGGTSSDPEAAFDSRLFNQDAGLASGSTPREDESNNCTTSLGANRPVSPPFCIRPDTKAWRKAASARRRGARPRSSAPAGLLPDRRFEGNRRRRWRKSARWAGQFEKQVEEDPFRLDDLFDNSQTDRRDGRTGSKRPASGHRDEGAGAT